MTVLVRVAVLLAMLLPWVAPSAAGDPAAPDFLRVRIDSVTPDIVTTSSEPVVTVTGTVTNVGDRPVRDVVVRLERAAPVESAPALRTSLDPAAGTQFEAVGEFASVATELDRGQASGFRLSAPLRGGSAGSLNVETPGVYPLLVNLNGTPDYGEPARLDDARFLLPVTGVPPGDAAANPLTDAVAPDTSRPVAVTMLWPLADKPRLAPGQPGGTAPVRLMNDDLAVSLAAGGRLDTLLGAAEFATSPGAIDPQSGVDRALCLAVDPDLLVTVNAMTAGYLVSTAPDGLGTQTQPGSGQAAATAWLERLRGLARRMCVTATPYAQADLGALHRVGDPGLGAAATAGADIVDSILGVVSTRGATLLGDAPLTAPAAALLEGQGPTVVITAADAPAPQRISPQVVVAAFDPAVGGALAGVGTDPSLPSYLDPALSAPVDRDSTVARRQDAVAAVLWRCLRPGVEPRTQILLPPLKWSPQPDDARAVLTAMANAMRSGVASPRPLSALLAETAAAAAEQPDPGLPTEVRGGFDDAVIAAITASLGRLGGLGAALTTDARTGLTGAQYTAPLREDMLRALSQTEAPDVRNEVARQRLAVVGRTVEDLFRAVTVVNPGGSYTLATERSALPLALRNDLAVPIRVRLQVVAPAGMTVTDIGEQEVPPGYLPLKVPVEVHLSRRVAVDVTLRTPDGVQLGEPVRLSVHSNAYGKLLFAITLAGGSVLALLVARRLYHRFRGQPDRADLDRPRRPAEIDA